MVARVEMITGVAKGKRERGGKKIQNKSQPGDGTGKPSSRNGRFGWLSLPAGCSAHGFSINLYSRGAGWPSVIALDGLESYFFCHRKDACLPFKSFSFLF